MDKSLFDQINQAVKDRSSWEDRQLTFYQMRNGGVRRKFKPYPNAPDLHYPLGDTLIEKLKPLYIQQLYSSETIASFVSRRTQDEDITASASYWFDYQLKQRSNFERTMFTAVDEMLQDGFTPVKVYWDEKCQRLAFTQVDPLHVIVPTNTQEYNQNGGADWLVHIVFLSEAEYRANPNFKQDDDFIKSIKGKGNKDGVDASGKQQAIELKEGINCSNNDNEIVLWEIYNRDRKDKKITIETISPMLGYEKEPVRDPFTQPFTKGVFKSGEHFPFFKVRVEIKGKGHLSSRGIIEINAPFENSLTKSWNTIHEHQDFFAKPMFTSTTPIPNAANWKSKPGAILPAGLQPVQTPPAPSSLREDMGMTRALAEDRTQVPDLGSSEHLSGKPGVNGSVTATQINAIVGQSGQGNDLRARVFRLDFGEGLNMAWSLYLQYAVGKVGADGKPDTASLSYLVDTEIRNVEPGTLHEEYEIVPNGSADSWNKGAQMQKRLAFYQTFQGNPFIDLGEMTKWVMEADEPRLVKRLFRSPEDATKDQEERQAYECLLIEANYGPKVKPFDDDKAHLKILDHWCQDKLMRQQMTPELARLALEHGSGHAQGLMQKKDPALKQIEAQMMPIVQILGQIAQQQDQPSNVLQMQAQGAQQPSALPPSHIASASPGPASSSKSDPVGDSAKLMNALASLIKAGVPITHAELDKTLTSAGLPPLSLNPIPSPAEQIQPQMQGAV